MRVPGELSSRPLAGGDLGRARWVETTAGPVVQKTYADVPAGLVEAEAAGLRWLAVPGGPPVPTVRAVDATSIVLDAVAEGAPSAAGAEAFGVGLAAVHAAGAETFGMTPSPAGFIGTVEVTTPPTSSFGSFWRARTDLLLARLVGDGPAGRGPAVDRSAFDALADRVETLVPAVAPARVHGDLWSGNVLWDERGTGWLIDPAAHGGHPELDLALLTLFGAPYLERILAAYADAAGGALVDGWRERLPFHQLHTLLFHAIAFGGGYLSRATDIAGRYR